MLPAWDIRFPFQRTKHAQIAGAIFHSKQLPVKSVVARSTGNNSHTKPADGLWSAFFDDEFLHLLLHTLAIVPTVLVSKKYA
ncbi:MAG TPA: hypothetical protein DCP92_14660 [Nitrospiraceae bacterium]|nr:hypothetical protein [Nitrospiraceae bacterium]